MGAVRTAVLAVGLAAVATLPGCDRIFGLSSRHADGGTGDDASDARIDAAPGTPLAWSAVSAGLHHTCGLQPDQSLWCWGRNDQGQLGAGSDVRELDVPTRIGNASWTAISAGAYDTCGVQTDGTLWCWGDDYQGVVGDGGNQTAFAPEQIGDPGVTWTTAVVGDGHACGIQSDGTLWCWGQDDSGQLGDGETTATVPAPVQEDSGNTWTAVSLGASSTCAIATDGTLWCWGNGTLGALGDGGTLAVADPEQIGTDTWTQLASGSTFACGLRSDGDVLCWGYARFGGIGNDNTGLVRTPTAIANGGSWLAVAARGERACAIKIDDTLWCWGANTTGELVRDTAPMDHSTIPLQVAAPSTRWLAVAAGDTHTCGLDAAHHLWCGGLNAGTLGIAGGGSRTTPVKVGNAASASAGASETCAIDAITTELACWGDNSQGAVGDNTLDNRKQPTAVGGATTWLQVAVGDHVCAIDATGVTSGNMYCWGPNYYGELGTGTTQSTMVPTKLVNIANWSAVAASSHTCAIAGGQLFCWGPNNAGQTGVSPLAMMQVLSPVEVGTSNSWTAIATGAGYSCGLTTFGDPAPLACWGANDYGQQGFLGVGSSTPMPDVAVGGQLAQLATGGQHTCVHQITAGEASEACWGNNGNGELGNGDTNTTATATVIAGDWLQLAAGDHFTCGVRIDGTLWCWGANDFGQLGIGTFVEHHEPQQVGSASTWTSVTAGAMHACATTAAHELYCWGDNAAGQVGDNAGWLGSLQLIYGGVP